MNKRIGGGSGRLWMGGAVALMLAGIAAAQDGTASKPGATLGPVPAWAFPGPLNKSVPGSRNAYSDVQMFDRTMAVIWFPDSHPPPPPAVRGRLQLYACGYCHLPEGAGRPENSALAGLTYEYFMQQVNDMRAGLRKPPSPTFGPAVNMMLTITHPQLQPSEIEAAAKYYSALKYTKHTRVVEATDIPKVTTNSFVYVFDETGAREPLGERIVEGADDFHRFEMRDPNVTFTAYVPVGSIARGAKLVKADGNPAIACETCHGEGLKGSIIGPPLAGRPVTYAFRQLAAFRNGTRDGVGSAFMKPVVANLSYRDMIDLSAYIGSLEP